MPSIDKRLNAFSRLGISINEALDNSETSTSATLHEAIDKANDENPWFTRAFIIFMLQDIASSLNKTKLQQWISKYAVNSSAFKPKRVGVVSAGNVPLVGFHDMLCVLMSGHFYVGKLSSKDAVLMKKIASLLCDIEPAFNARISFVDGPFKDIDAIIATGSNNTARYFDYYFGKYPNIIRKNRNGLAILSGIESSEELECLADDIFLYYGLGCRNVSKIFVPKDYNFDPLFQALEKYRFVIENNKYANNYMYHKSICFMNNEDFLDNQFLLIKENSSIHSPIATIHFDYYESTVQIHNFVQQNSEHIQCIASNMHFDFDTVKLGTTQHPELWDYSDNIDTFAFLLNV